MLTRKQLWRRTRERTRKPLFKSKHDSFDGIEDIPTLERTENPAPQTPVPLKSALSSSNLLSLGLSSRRARDQRLLRFSSTVHVLLIPSRAELLPIFESIYWRQEDYTHFKRDAVKEIREAAYLYGLPPKEAMTLLYQPQPELKDDSESLRGMVHEENQPNCDYYVSDYATNHEYANQNVSIDYQYHCNNHPSTMARKDSNFLLEQQASPHSVTVASSPTTARDLKFITNVKTDVELNSSGVDSSSGVRFALGGKQPRRTTTSTPQKQHAWAVQWKKQPAVHA